MIHIVLVNEVNIQNEIRIKKRIVFFSQQFQGTILTDYNLRRFSITRHLNTADRGCGIDNINSRNMMSPLNQRLAPYFVSRIDINNFIHLSNVYIIFRTPFI